jgi:hypothetical protein
MSLSRQGFQICPSQSEFPRLGAGIFLNVANLSKRPVEDGKSTPFYPSAEAILTSDGCDTRGIDKVF